MLEDLAVRTLLNTRLNRRSRRRRGNRPVAELLERRVLLVADLDLVNRQLIITSVVFGAEIYTVTFDGTNFTVNTFFEGFTAQYPASLLQPAGQQPFKLVIRTNNAGTEDAPGDIISIGQSGTPITLPTTILPTKRDDFILCGDGPTTVTHTDLTIESPADTTRGAGADFIVGGAGNDVLNGYDGRPQRNMIPAGDDTLYGGGGNDILDGGASPNADDLGDVLIGGAGNDILIGGGGRDLMDGGTGINTLSYEEKTVEVDLIFPNRDNEDFDPMDPDGITPDNFPKLGFGTVMFMNDERIQDERDQLYDGLETIFDRNDPTSVAYDVVTADHTDLLGDGTFQILIGGDGPSSHDIIDVSLLTTAFTIIGNDGVDSIFGGEGNDIIDGGANTIGNPRAGARDNLVGGPGNDTIHGGPNGDSILGGSGDDVLFGDEGGDVIHGGAGNDLIDGGEGNDLMTGDFGDGSLDTTPAGGGNDTLVGGTEGDGEDTLQGDGGIDTADYSMRTVGVRITFDDVHDDGADGELDFVTESTEIGIGGSGPDVLNSRTDGVARTLRGGAGDDTLISGSGADLLSGEAGFDTVSYAGRTVAVTVTLDGVANDGGPGESDNVDNTNETIIGGSGNDTLNASAKTTGVRLIGGAGNDTLTGGSGNDTLDGQAGADVMIGNAGVDLVTYASRTASVNVTLDNVANDGEAGEGDNVQTTIEQIIGGSGNDVLNGSGTAADLTLRGGAGNDLLIGGPDNDSINGEDGNDTIDGGLGADGMFGGPGTDTITYASRVSGVIVTLDSNENDGAPGEMDFVDPTSFETIIGGSGNDSISAVGTNRAIVMFGGAGNDTLLGSTVGDMLDGGVGDDSVSGGSGNDTLLGNDGNDTLRGGNGADQLNGGGGDDLLDGESGADTMIGSAGNDTATYAGRSARIFVTIDTIPNDGESGEGDRIDAATVETVIGGSGSDVMTVASTITTAIHFIGGPGNDALTGGSASDTLDGDSGSDTLTGAAGDDSITGGLGNDILRGGTGNDSLFGSDGHDTLDGGANADLLVGGGGIDTVDYTTRTEDLVITMDDLPNDGALGENDNVDSSNEIIITGSGNDSLSAAASSLPHALYGNTGNDTLVGGPGGDRLHGGFGDDSLSGGVGNDTLLGGRGDDIMSGGPGIDQVTYYYETNPIVVTMDGIANDGIRKAEFDNVMTDIEQLVGGQAKDTLVGNSANNLIIGNGGNDFIQGLNGHDTLIGNDGSDTLNGGNGNDVLDGGLGPDRFIGGKGTDTADYSNRTEDLFLSLDDRTNDGAVGEFDKIDDDIEILIGGSGNDMIFGSFRNETLDGGLGDDTIDGGGGIDEILNAGS